MRKTETSAPLVDWKHPPQVGLSSLAKEMRTTERNPEPHLVYDAGRIVGVYFPLYYLSGAGERAIEYTAKRLEIEAFYVARWLEKYGPAS